MKDLLDGLRQQGYWEWCRDERRIVYTNGEVLVKVDPTRSWNHNEAYFYPDTILDTTSDYLTITVPFGCEPEIKVYK